MAELLPEEPLSATQLRGLVAGLPGAAVFVVNHEMRYTLAEGEALRATDGQLPALVGKTVAETMPPALVDSYEEHYREVLAGGHFAIEHQAHGAWYVTRGAPLFDGQGRVVAAMAFSFDITKRKQAEEQLRRAGESFYALVANAPFGIYVVDADFRLAQVSAGAQRVFSNVRPLIGRDFDEVIRIIWPEPVASELLRRFRHTLATGEAYQSFGYTEHRADTGQREWYDWQLERVTLADGRLGVVCYFYDSTARQAAEDLLRGSEQRLNLALQAAELGTWEWDVATGAVLWDERARSLFEFNADAAVHLNDFTALLHPDDVARNRATTERALMQGQYASEFRVCLPSGRVRHVMSQGVVVGGGADDGADGGERRRMIGVVQDVTELRVAEAGRARVAERQAFELALAQALRGQTGPGQLKDAVVALLGAAMQACRVQLLELGDAGLDTVIEHEYRDGVAAMAGHARPSVYGELVLRCAQGEVLRIADLDLHDGLAVPLRQALAGWRCVALLAVPLLRAGRCTSVLMVQHAQRHDWTDEEVWRVLQAAERTSAAVERADAERAVHDSEERFRTLLSIVTDVVWTSNAQGAFVQAQPAWEAYTGQSWLAHQGSGWLHALHAEDRPRLTVEWTRAVHNRTAFASQGRLWHDGSQSWRRVVIRATPLADALGQVQEWVGACNDVEDERRASDLLHDQDRRKDTFLATLAHELRNPLAPVRTAARLLGMTDGRSEQAVQARAIIERQTQHMALLLDDLLDVARIAQGKVVLRPQLLDLSQAVEAALEVARPLMQQNHHHLATRLPPHPVVVNADPVRLAQVLGNLLTNAAKFTPPGGHIRLSAQVNELAREITLEITDTGIGIPADALEGIFGMFVQVPEHRAHRNDGLGIGLAIVKGLMELHGGRVTVRSGGVGTGTTFGLVLPLPQASALPASPTAHESAGPIQLPSVLVVDDNRDAAESLAMYLQALRHEVRVAEDGIAALALATEMRPAVVLLDIGMPGMDGYAVARQLRTEPWARELRLAALTGWGQTQDRHRAFKAGFDAHFTKPVDLDKLHEWLMRR